MAVTSFLRQFDDIVNEILVDYINLDDPPPDTSRGSMPYIFANVMASQSYGLNAKLNFIANQIGPIPSTSTEFLDRYGAVYNIPRFTDEENGDYYNRLINRLQNPPSGGNANDYSVWALDRNAVNTVDGSTTYYNAFATITDADPVPGSVKISTIPNDETIIDDVGPPNNEENLRVATFNYIESVRPLGILQTVVVSAKPAFTSVSIQVIAGENFNQANAISDVENYGNSLGPGETMYTSQLQCICIANGAVSATVTIPSGDILVSNEVFTRFSTVTILEVAP